MEVQQAIAQDSENCYQMCSNYLRTKLLQLEDFVQIHVFIFTDACGHQVYITYIDYICNIISVLKILEYHSGANIEP